VDFAEEAVACLRAWRDSASETILVMGTPAGEVFLMALGRIGEYSSEELVFREMHVVVRVRLKGASYARCDMRVPTQVLEAGYKVSGGIEITLPSGQNLTLFERSRLDRGD
jgi:hypothetical protein